MLRVSLEPVRDEAAGWQLLDARTGALIEEGPWVTEAVESEVPIPTDDGDYRVLVSTVSAERGWAYSRGASMRVVDVAVRHGAQSVTNDRRTTIQALRWLGLPARLANFAVEPWLLIWRNRSLIVAMVERDLEGRYKGSYGDRFWTIAQPLFLMLAYWFVFGVVLKTRFGDDPNPSIYMLFFLCGMIPWLAISEAVGRAPSVILEHRNFVKKLVFPVEILPVNLVFSGLVSAAFALVIYLFFLASRRDDPPDSHHTRRLLGLGRHRPLRPRSWSSQRLPPHPRLLPHPHLLPHGKAARGSQSHSAEIPGLQTGGGIPPSVHLRRPAGLARYGPVALHEHRDFLPRIWSVPEAAPQLSGRVIKNAGIWVA